MSQGYVVKAHKPTSVTHSCSGNFTAPNELNLIIAKCTRIEIHLVTPDGLEPMLDVPIYGRIVALELFRPHGKEQDLLFVSTERHSCVLQWDVEASKVITRVTRDVADRGTMRPMDSQIRIIDPYGRSIGLHLYKGLFKVIPFDGEGQLETESFNISLLELDVLDIKFLYGCDSPTIAVLYQDSYDTRNVRIYEVLLELEEPTEPILNDLEGASFLIPVPPPLCGMLVIGERYVLYHGPSATESAVAIHSIRRAYGRVDAYGSKYLLGDANGVLLLLEITHERNKVTGLSVTGLGVTSIASTISYLDEGFVYIGSRDGDSQKWPNGDALIKLNLRISVMII